jgi:16S rRNA (cytidine1402-2'-O)-methyltransferase
MTGCLYLVSLPIGNPEDLTLRARRILRQVSCLAAEDPRTAQILLRRHRIHTPVTSYHNENKEVKAPVLISRLQEGRNVALVCDAGTPLIEDPGAYLVQAAIRAGLRVVPVPGPSALLAALVVSGLPCQRVLFLGRLPRGRAERLRMLNGLRAEPGTIVLYVASARLPDTLGALRAVLGDRQVALALDLTKPEEVVLRGTLAHVIRLVQDQRLSGEITLVVAGRGRKHPYGAARDERRISRSALSGS